ncbi:hypothetical protein D3C71_1239470 [compost metagenome]
MFERRQMEDIINATARGDQRILVTDIANDKAESLILELPAHRHLSGLTAGEYDNFLRILRQKLPNQLMPPGTGAACDHNPFIIEHAGSLQAKI